MGIYLPGAQAHNGHFGFGAELHEGGHGPVQCQSWCAAAAQWLVSFLSRLPARWGLGGMWGRSWASPEQGSNRKWVPDFCKRDYSEMKFKNSKFGDSLPGTKSTKYLMSYTVYINDAQRKILHIQS